MFSDKIVSRQVQHTHTLKGTYKQNTMDLYDTTFGVTNYLRLKFVTRTKKREDSLRVKTSNGDRQ
jgi:hypothetical protein